MSADRILLIENPAHLSVDHGRLRIQREGCVEAFAAAADVAVVCLHHHAITLSVHVLRLLAAAGAVVLVTNETHHPAALMVPLSANQALPQRLEQQIRVRGTPLVAHCWGEIVRARIRSQAANLRHFGLNGALRLDRLAAQVEDGDPQNLEAQAARHYWSHYFGDDFARQRPRADDAVNARLNYGYAVLRAMVARQLVMSGLNTTLGLGHNSSENPFNLADDFVEAYRYLVERHVRADEHRTTALTPHGKVELLQFLEQEVELRGRSFRLASAVAETAASYCRILENGSGALSLP